jgi:hypothetical protein
MKKFFLFAAAVVAAMTVNAKVLDLRVVGLSIDDWTILEATLNGDNTDPDAGKYVYDIKAGVASETYVNADEDVVFQLKNGSDKAKAFVVYPGKCYEFGGKNGILILKNTAAGDKIQLLAAAKGSNDAKFADPDDVYPKNAIAVSEDLVLPKKGSEGGDEQGYVWVVLEFASLGGDVEIKEFNGGYRIAALSVGEELPQGILNTEAATVKAEKFFRNGQLIIRKNGVEYNALGAQL